MASAQVWTIRVKLLKLGTQIRVSIRKVWFSFTESYSYANTLRKILDNLQRIPLRY